VRQHAAARARRLFYRRCTEKTQCEDHSDNPKTLLEFEFSGAHQCQAPIVAPYYTTADLILLRAGASRS
jgi:hypothetical protein